MLLDAALSELVGRARLNGLHAGANEVINLLGDYLRADIGDLNDCFLDDGRLDLKRAKALDLTRVIKKYRTHTRMIQRRNRPTETVTTVMVELHDAQSAAKMLVKLLGLRQTANPK